MNAFALLATLGLDTSEYDKGLSNAKSAGSALGSGLASAAKVGLAAVGAATTAVVGFGATSVKTGAEFDKSMSQVAATMGKTMEEMQNEVGSVDLAWGTFSGNLREYAQEMGKNTAFSATEAADALNYMALAGYDTQTSMQMLPNVLNLAAAGDMELARASDMVTDTQTAFGISLERTSQMVDEMAKAASTGNTSVEQLGDAFLTVGGLAKELNGGMVTLADGTQKPVDGVQELEIALTAMANAGIKGSEAGTHMRNMLLKLASPTEAGVKELEALGVSVFDTEGNMRSLKDIMGDLSGAMNNLTQEEKLQAISDLFNTRDTASAEALLAAVGQDWDKIGESILDAEGAAQQMADTQLDNLAGDVTLFKSALEGARIAISDVLSPTLREFVKFGTDGLSTLTSAFQEGGLSGAMEAFGTILADGLNMVIEKLPEMVNAGMQLLSALGQGLLQNLPAIIDAANQIIPQLVQGLIQSLPALVDGALQIIVGLADGITQMLPTLIPTIVEVVLQIVQTLIDNAPMLIDAGLQLLLGLVQGFSKALPQLISALPKIITSLIDAIVQALPMIIDAIVTAIPLFIDGAIQLTNGIVGALPEIIQALVDALPTIIESIVSGLMECLPQLIAGNVMLITALAGHLPEIIMALIEAIPQVIAAIIQGFSPLTDSLVQVFSNAFNAVSSWFSSIFGAVGEKIGEFLTAVGEFFAPIIEIFQPVLDALAFLFDTVWTGIKDAVTNKVEEMKQGAVEKWNSMKESVSTAMENVKEAVTTGYDVINQLTGGRLGEMISTVSSKMEQVRSSFKSKMDSLKEAAQTAISNMVNTVSNLMSDLKEKFTTWGKDMLDNFINGIKSKMEDLAALIRKIAELIANILGFSEPEEGPLSNFHTFAPDMMDLFMQGVRDKENELRNVIEDAFDIGGIIKGDADLNISSGSAIDDTIISLLQEIRDNGTVVVSLEGDADRLFRVMQSKATSNYRLTGQASMVTT